MITPTSSVGTGPDAAGWARSPKFGRPVEPDRTHFARGGGVKPRAAEVGFGRGTWPCCHPADADHRTKGSIMGFTGLLILARTEAPLTDLYPLAGHGAELVSRRHDHWQLAAVAGHTEDTPDWVAALVETTAAPVLIAAVDDSDTALLLADSPEAHRWISVLGAPADSAGRAAVADIRAMTAIAEVAVAWAAETGRTVATEPVLEALCAADRDNQAADQAMINAAGDVATMTEVMRYQVSFIEVYVMRVLAMLGLPVLVEDAGSWWAHLAAQVDTRSP
jgi:hypothetical protein